MLDQMVSRQLEHIACNQIASSAAHVGEVAMLSSANNEISLRAAATNARNTQLILQVEGLTARLIAAEQQITDRESSLNNARVAMVEKDSGLRRLEAHVAALQQQLVTMGQAARKQETTIRFVSKMEPSSAQAVLADASAAREQRLVGVIC